jgi:hypothetical protein
MPGSPPISTTPTFDEAATEHPIELVDERGKPRDVLRPDVGQRHHFARPRQPENRFVPDRTPCSTAASTSVFQAWQWGHCPCHLRVCPPHSVQEKILFGFAIRKPPRPARVGRART